MKKNALIFLLGLWATPVYATEASLCPYNWIQGHSIASESRQTMEICHSKIAIRYDTECRIPMLVSERLVVQELKGEVEREGGFVPDPYVRRFESATTRDYVSSGYDKGHLAPAANFSGDPVAMRESFFYSNTAPQLPEHNRIVWKKLEDQTRRDSMNDGEGDRHIMTGTIISSSPERLNGRVCIPDAFYKIVHYPKSNTYRVWLIPHVRDVSREPSIYETSLEDVEKRTGINFFSKGP